MYKILAKTSFIGKKLIFMPSCHSTNDICAELISKGDVMDGTVVITDLQKSGKGQASNSWESKQGENLTLSIILDTSFLAIQDQFYLNMMVCLSLSDLLREYVSTGVSIKWPNDIYYMNRKICGVLIQNTLKGSKLEFSILGLGVNVNQQKFETRNAISLNNITGRSYSLESVLERLTGIMEKHLIMLKNGHYGKLKGMYMSRLMWINEDHVFKSSGSFKGRITDIDERGRLIVFSNGELKAFDFKEIEFIV